MIDLIVKVKQEYPEVGKGYEISDLLAAEIRKPGNEEIFDYCVHAVCLEAVSDYTVVEEYHKEREAKKASDTPPIDPLLVPHYFNEVERALMEEVPDRAKLKQLINRPDSGHHLELAETQDPWFGSLVKIARVIEHAFEKEGIDARLKVSFEGKIPKLVAALSECHARNLMIEVEEVDLTALDDPPL
jgi:hypothetical protein